MNLPNEFYNYFTKYTRSEWGKQTGHGGNTNRWEARDKARLEDGCQALIDLLTKLYWEDEYGYKLLAAKANTTYTIMRMAFEYFEIPVRTGTAVVTGRLLEFRKAKAIYESKHKIGFNCPNIIRKGVRSRGICGRYYNKSLGKEVYLRSTYEWVFAKWLDKTKQIWDIEVKVYMMPDGRAYRPDFFIYDEAGTLIKIVEIKGYFDSNSDKAEKLNEKLDIPVVIISNIDHFIPSGSNYHKELAKWKIINEN